MSKAIVYFADGTEECEGLVVVDILRRAGVQVITASINTMPRVLTSHKIVLTTDTVAEGLDVSDADLLVLPGGIPGTPNLKACPAVIEAVRQQAAAGKKLAAICAAPGILAGLGLLDGKTATIHPGCLADLTGAEYQDAECVVAGNITTGSGLGAAIPFALELAAQLEGPEKAEAVRKAIVYRH